MIRVRAGVKRKRILKDIKSNKKEVRAERNHYLSVIRKRYQSGIVDYNV